jgi:hypothetical protein
LSGTARGPRWRECLGPSPIGARRTLAAPTGFVGTSTREAADGSWPLVRLCSGFKLFREEGRDRRPLGKSAAAVGSTGMLWGLRASTPLWLWVASASSPHSNRNPLMRVQAAASARSGEDPVPELRAADQLRKLGRSSLLRPAARVCVHFSRLEPQTPSASFSSSTAATSAGRSRELEQAVSECGLR